MFCFLLWYFCFCSLSLNFTSIIFSQPSANNWNELNLPSRIYTKYGTSNESIHPSIHPFVHPFIHHHCTHLFTQEVNLSIDAAWSCLPNILNIHIVGTKHAHWSSTHSSAYPLSEKFLRFSLWSTVEQKFNPLVPCVKWRITMTMYTVLHTQRNWYGDMDDNDRIISVVGSSSFRWSNRSPLIGKFKLEIDCRQHWLFELYYLRFVLYATFWDISRLHEIVYYAPTRERACRQSTFRKRTKWLFIIMKI